MKLQTEQNEIVRVGVGSESAFTIKASPKTFDILSSGIYTDPILAIVRELSCNAYDSHVAAKKADIPFEVHLPNQLEPWFSVKDFGTGLHDDDIRGNLTEIDIDGEKVIVRQGGLYTTYFESNKTNSNDFIGALGLGSKTPFAYVSAFEVISRFNGFKSIYSIFLNEDNIPTVALMSQCNTTESSGLEIIVSIKPDNFFDFANKLSSALRWFPVKPTVTGVPNFSFDDTHVTNIKGQKFVFVKHAEFRRRINAVQGNVEYKIDINQITDSLSEADKHFVKFSKLILFFDIGELDVAASREEIRYNKQTIQNIVSVIKSARTKLIFELLKSVSNTTSCWETFLILEQKIADDLNTNFSNVRKILNSSNIDLPPNVLRVMTQKSFTVPFSQLFGFYVVKYVRKNSNKCMYSRKTINNPSNSNVFPNSYIRMYWVGPEKRLAGRITKLFEEKPELESVYMFFKELNSVKITYDENHEIVKTVMTPKDYNDEIELIKSQLGDPPFFQTSTLPEPPKIVRSKTSYRTTYGQTYKIDKYDLTNTTQDFSEFSLYFRVSGGRNIWSGYKAEDKVISWSSFMRRNNIQLMVDVINETCQTEYLIDNVRGIGKRGEKRILKSSNHKNIFEVFRNEVIPVYQKHFAEYEKFHQFSDSSFFVKDLLLSKYEHIKQKFLKLYPLQNKDGLFRILYDPLVDNYNQWNDSVEHMKFVYDLAILINAYFPSSSTKETIITTQTHEISKKYPLISVLDKSKIFMYGNDIVSDVMSYITLIDKQDTTK